MFIYCKDKVWDVDTLAQVLPSEFSSGEFNNTKAYKYKDEAVLAIAEDHPWPGREKNVKFWVVLFNGRAVGFNENPSKGWSFPVIRFQKAFPYGRVE